MQIYPTFGLVRYFPNIGCEKDIICKLVFIVSRDVFISKIKFQPNTLEQFHIGLFVLVMKSYDFFILDDLFNDPIRLYF